MSYQSGSESGSFCLFQLCRPTARRPEELSPGEESALVVWQEDEEEMEGAVEDQLASVLPGGGRMSPMQLQLSSVAEAEEDALAEEKEQLSRVRPLWPSPVAELPLPSSNSSSRHVSYTSDIWEPTPPYVLFACSLVVARLLSFAHSALLGPLVSCLVGRRVRWPLHHGHMTWTDGCTKRRTRTPRYFSLSDVLSLFMGSSC